MIRSNTREQADEEMDMARNSVTVRQTTSMPSLHEQQRAMREYSSTWGREVMEEVQQGRRMGKTGLMTKKFDKNETAKSLNKANIKKLYENSNKRKTDSTETPRGESVEWSGNGLRSEREGQEVDRDRNLIHPETLYATEMQTDTH